MPPDFSEEEIDRRVLSGGQRSRPRASEGSRDRGDPSGRSSPAVKRKRVNIALEPRDRSGAPLPRRADERPRRRRHGGAHRSFERDLAKRYGKTILVTIHQPAREEYEKFNLALVLGFGGEPLYYGPGPGRRAIWILRPLRRREGQDGRQPARHVFPICFDCAKKTRCRATASPTGPPRASPPRRPGGTNTIRDDNPVYKIGCIRGRASPAPRANRGAPRAREGAAPPPIQAALRSMRHREAPRPGGHAHLARPGAHHRRAPWPSSSSTPIKAPNLWCKQFLQGIEATAAAQRPRNGRPRPAWQTSRASRRSPTSAVGALFFLLDRGDMVRDEQRRAREIVSEIAIYRRERMVNLSIVNYVLSKFWLLSLLCLVQCSILLVIVFLALGLGDGDPIALLWMLLFLVSTSTCAVADWLAPLDARRLERGRDGAHAHRVDPAGRPRRSNGASADDEQELARGARWPSCLRGWGFSRGSSARTAQPSRCIGRSRPA